MSDAAGATGSVTIVGLGPGDPRLLTESARAALDRAQDLIGYIPYVARVPEREGLVRHASDNRVEVDRARHALELAMSGRHVAVVSGGLGTIVIVIATALIWPELRRFGRLDGTPEDGERAAGVIG